MKRGETQERKKKTVANRECRVSQACDTRARRQLFNEVFSALSLALAPHFPAAARWWLSLRQIFH